MSDTTEIALSNSSWTDISGGVAYGFFTNHSDRSILYREALVPPADSVDTGHRLNPGDDKQYALTDGQKIWARVVPTLVGPPVTIIVTQGYGSLASGGSLSHDFLCEVNQGKVPGHTLVHKFGDNPDVGVVDEDIWEAGGLLQWLTTAETMDVISTDIVNDISTGSGARTVKITGLDINFNEITEIITLLAVVVTTTLAFRRILDAQVIDVGTYTGTNIGDISITATISATTQGIIGVGEGALAQTQYTIPAGKTGYMLRTGLTMSANKEVEISLLNRERADVVTAPFGACVDDHHWDGVATPINNRFFANHKFPEKTDVWFRGLVTSTPNGSIAVDYDLLLVDN